MDIGDDVGSEILRWYRESLESVSRILGREAKSLTLTALHSAGAGASRLAERVRSRTEAAAAADPVARPDGFLVLYAASREKAAYLCGEAADAGLEAFTDARWAGARAAQVKGAGDAAAMKAGPDGLFRIYVAEDAEPGYVSLADLDAASHPGILDAKDRKAALAEAAWEAECAMAKAACDVELTPPVPGRPGNAVIGFTTVQWDPNGGKFTDTLDAGQIPYILTVKEGMVEVEVCAERAEDARKAAYELATSGQSGLSPKRFSGLEGMGEDPMPPAHHEFVCSLQDAEALKCACDAASVGYVAHINPETGLETVVVEDGDVERLAEHNESALDTLEDAAAPAQVVAAREYHAAYSARKAKAAPGSGELAPRKVVRTYEVSKPDARTASAKIADDLARASRAAAAKNQAGPAPERKRSQGSK